MTEGASLAAAARDWFHTVAARCDARARRAPTAACAWQAGPVAIEQRWFGEARFERLHRPLAHLAAPGGPGPRLRIDCFDGKDGIGLGLSPFRKRHLGPNRGIPALERTNLRVLWDHDHGFVQALDLETGRGFFFVEAFDRLPEWEPTIPFRSFVHWWAAREGHVFLHAGSVGGAQGGIVLLGAAGAGKSTTTLAAVEAGLRTCGDDYVLVTLGTAPHVHSVYGTAKIKDGNTLVPRFARDRLGATAVRVANKTILFPATELAGSFAGGFPLRTLALLSFSGTPETTVVPASAAEAVRAAAPSTVLQMAYDQSKCLSAVAALVRKVPCLHFRLGSDIAGVGRTLAAVVNELRPIRDAA